MAGGDGHHISQPAWDAFPAPSNHRAEFRERQTMEGPRGNRDDVGEAHWNIILSKVIITPPDYSAVVFQSKAVVLIGADLHDMIQPNWNVALTFIVAPPGDDRPVGAQAQVVVETDCDAN